MNTFDALVLRKSIDKYDTTKKLTREQITELVDYAQQAPSAFNIQHTRYIVIEEQRAKDKLKDICYGQQKVSDAAAVFVVLGDVQGIERLPDISKRALEKGVYDKDANAHVVEGAKRFYGENVQMMQEEAIRSASLASMNLMTAATAKGLATGPMIGFDPERLKKEFCIAARYMPIMLITVGYAGAGNWDKKPRLTADEVTVFDGQCDSEHMFSH